MNDLHRIELIPASGLSGAHGAWLPIEVLEPGWAIARELRHAARQVDRVEDRLARLIAQRDALWRTRERGGAFGDGVFTHPRADELEAEIEGLQKAIDDTVQERDRLRTELEGVEDEIRRGYVAVEVAPARPAYREAR